MEGNTGGRARRGKQRETAGNLRETHRRRSGNFNRAPTSYAPEALKPMVFSEIRPVMPKKGDCERKHADYAPKLQSGTQKTPALPNAWRRPPLCAPIMCKGRALLHYRVKSWALVWRHLRSEANIHTTSHSKWFGAHGGWSVHALRALSNLRPCGGE